MRKKQWRGGKKSFDFSSPGKGLGCLPDRCPPAVETGEKRSSAEGATGEPARRQGGIDLTYLGYFEELRYPSHSGEELLVNVQTLFTLRLLHVKVFLCSSDKSRHTTCGRQAEDQRWRAGVLPSRLMMPSL